MSNIYNETKQMFSEFESLKNSILGSEKQNETAFEKEEKILWAKAENFAPIYNPNTDEISWVQKPKTTLEKLPNYMQVEGSMSPEQISNSYPIFQWKANSGLNDSIQKVVQDCIDGNISVQHAEELLTQMAKDSYSDAKKATKWSPSQLKESDKVGTKKERDAILAKTGGDVSTVSKYMKEISA